MNPKSPVDSQKNKWKTDTTKWSTEYKVSKALITDLDTKHWTYKPSKRTKFKSQDEENSNKESSKALRQENNVAHKTFRLTKSCH